MADHDSASVITLHQPRPKTPAERAAAYRARKRAKLPAVIPASASTPVTLLPPEERRALQAEPVSRRSGAPLQAAAPTNVSLILLTIAALALAVVGMTMNGWYARSLGSTESAGLLFLAIGIAADLVALVVPSCAAGLWQARQRATALAGWSVWALTFIVAITASVGFAATNISDVTASRASRVTPAVTAAQTALADAVTARDRECKGGVGRFCREREAAVNERRQAVEAVMHGVEQTADPQTLAAIRVVSWVSLGTLRPTENDFSMLRLVLLPQIGGIVLMIGRAHLERPAVA